SAHEGSLRAKVGDCGSGTLSLSGWTTPRTLSSYSPAPLKLVAKRVTAEDGYGAFPVITLPFRIPPPGCTLPVHEGYAGTTLIPLQLPCVDFYLALDILCALNLQLRKIMHHLEVHPKLRTCLEEPSETKGRIRR